MFLRWSRRLTLAALACLLLAGGAAELARWEARRGERSRLAIQASSEAFASSLSATDQEREFEALDTRRERARSHRTLEAFSSLAWLLGAFCLWGAGMGRLLARAVHWDQVDR